MKQMRKNLLRAALSLMALALLTASLAGASAKYISPVVQSTQFHVYSIYSFTAGETVPAGEVAYYVGGTNGSNGVADGKSGGPGGTADRLIGTFRIAAATVMTESTHAGGAGANSRGGAGGAGTSLTGTGVAIYAGGGGGGGGASGDSDSGNPVVRWQGVKGGNASYGGLHDGPVTVGAYQGDGDNGSSKGTQDTARRLASGGGGGLNGPGLGGSGNNTGADGNGHLGGNANAGSWAGGGGGGYYGGGGGAAGRIHDNIQDVDGSGGGGSSYTSSGIGTIGAAVGSPTSYRDYAKNYFLSTYPAGAGTYMVWLGP